MEHKSQCHDLRQLKVEQLFSDAALQSFLPKRNKSHSVPISIFMAKIGECKYKEILQSGGLLTGKVHNSSVRGRDLPPFTMVTIVLSEDSLF